MARAEVGESTSAGAAAGATGAAAVWEGCSPEMSSPEISRPEIAGNPIRASSNLGRRSG